jgi:hypothetical protein
MTFQRLVLTALLIIIYLLTDNETNDSRKKGWITELEKDINNWDSRDSHSTIFTR